MKISECIARLNELREIAGDVNVAVVNSVVDSITDRVEYYEKAIVELQFCNIAHKGDYWWCDEDTAIGLNITDGNTHQIVVIR